MPYFDDYESELPSTIRGYNSVLAAQLDSTTAARALFFCPSLTFLAGLRDELNNAAAQPGRLPTKNEIPSKVLIGTVASYGDPVSLDSIFRVRNAAEAVLKSTRRRDQALKARLAAHADKKTNRIPISIEVSFHLPRWDKLDAFQASVIAANCGEFSDEYDVSFALTEGLALWEGHRRVFFSELRKGYHSDRGGEGGAYTITEKTAEAIAKNGGDIATKANKVKPPNPVSAPPVADLFHFGTRVGPDRGKRCRALSRHSGNVVE